MTTLGVGGAAGALVTATSRDEIVAAVRSADAAGSPLLVIAGGSNLVVSDDGWPGTVLALASRGVQLGETDPASGAVLVTAEAGHPWDELVEQTVQAGLSGLEALSGIPGSVGATPVQNVGAYGAEVSQTLVGVDVFDRATDQVKQFSVGDLRLGYRDSAIKRSIEGGAPRYIVLAVSFRLHADEGRPVAYQQLASALGVEVGERAAPADVRRAVLELRASKGMVLDPQDADTRSCGSFFTNPIVDAAVADALPADAPRYPVATAGQLKLSAAWLIENAGFHKGFGLAGTPGEELAQGRAALSTKHTLALTNRGDASCQDVLAVARAVRDGVEATWGIRMDHEPLFIGVAL